MARLAPMAAVSALALAGCGSSGDSSGTPQKAENGPLAVSVFQPTVDNPGVGIYRRDPSGRRRRLTFPKDGRDLFPTWSHDGKRIAFVRESRSIGLEQGLVWLFVVNADGGGVRRVGDVVAASAQISWGADDDSIVFVGANSRIWRVNADGSGLKQLHAEEARDPTWSPDGQRIVFGSFGAHGLTSIDAAGGNTREITHPRTPAGALLPNSQLRPAWSPDGRRIAFVQKVWRASKSLLYPTTIEVVNADGTGQRTLTKVFDESSVYFTWSPDGRSIAFSDLRAELGIWVVSSGGGKAHLLLRGGQYTTPSWGPAGA